MVYGGDGDDAMETDVQCDANTASRVWRRWTVEIIITTTHI